MLDTVAEASFGDYSEAHEFYQGVEKDFGDLCDQFGNLAQKLKDANFPDTFFESIEDVASLMSDAKDHAKICADEAEKLIEVTPDFSKV